MKSSETVKLPSSKPWLRLADIAENIQRILTYTDGMNLSDFIADERTSDATERCMMRISEAAVKLGSLAEELLPAHDWQSIRGIGNVLRHDYDQIVLPIIWDSAKTNLPSLLADIKAATARHQTKE